MIYSLLFWGWKRLQILVRGKDWGEGCVVVLAFWTSRTGREGLAIGGCGRSSARRRKYYGSREWKFGREDGWMGFEECLDWISMEKKKVASKQMEAISRSTGLKSVEKMMFCVTIVRCNVGGGSRSCRWKEYSSFNM